MTPARVPARAALIAFVLASLWLLRSAALRQGLLAAVAIPDLGVVLVTCGILLVYLEFNVPGAALPGSLGALLVMFGLYGLSRHAVHPAALASIAAGILLTGCELRWPSRAVLAAAGATALALGLIHLEAASPPLHLPVAILAAISFSAATVWLGRIALLARRNKQSRLKTHTFPA